MLLGLSVRLSLCLCLSTRLLRKLGADFDEIFWKGGAWPRTK